MRKLLLLLALLQIFFLTQAQTSKGKVIVERFYAPSLENKGGENPTRRVSVYLPPGYEHTTNRYPVLYYLHGFTWSDSLQIAVNKFDEFLDKAILNGIIKPVIVVMPNHYTMYKGSFYSNSTLTGNWADYTAKDLVNFIDQRYRTIANRNSRGITGHSMGGHGALKIAMLFPDVFSSVYALSPAVLALVKEIGIRSEGFKQVQNYKTKEELLNTFLPLAVIVLGRTYSPNLAKPPFYCDLPFIYQGDSIITDNEVLDLWNKNMPYNMIDTHLENLQKLKALKLDWGRNEEFEHIPLACKMFSQKLENSGIEHYAEEYIGTHGNKLLTDDGRVLNDMLPFFNTHLDFEELKLKTIIPPKKTKK